MNKKFIILLTFLFVAIMAKISAQSPTPPKAKKIQKVLEKHGHKRIDNYYWLNQREDKEVIKYLEDENTYTEAVMKPTEQLQNKIFEEIKGRIKQTDMSVPYQKDGYWYYTRFEEGKEYPIYGRKKGSMEKGKEEILLNVNELAQGKEYCAVSGLNISDNDQIMAFGVDYVGRRKYEIQFKDLKTGKILPTKIPVATGSVSWSTDSKYVFYSFQNETTLRSEKIFRHELNTDSKKDILVYHEKDETFYTSVYRTKSKKYLVIASGSSVSSEMQTLDAAQPTGNFKIFQTREKDHLYSIDHYQDHFYITTNWQAPNFRLMQSSLDKTEKATWKELIAHRKDVLLESLTIFKDFYVLEERKNGLIQLRVMGWKGKEDDKNNHYIDFGEPTYLAYPTTNMDYNTSILRFGYTSMTTPNSTYDYDMKTRKKTLLKQQEVVGGHNPDDYVTERIYADALDGTKTPISLVYKKGMKKDGSNPCFLYGYGSYGNTLDASFSVARLSLLQRGFVYAIAHIRGGQEMGRFWYDEGKMFNKKNTFTDFIACAEYMIAQKFTNKEKMFAEGGSAGGLLIGAVANMRPDLFKGMIAAVPFVDVVTTMLDDTIPLTTGEYDEWGNPNNIDSYIYMLSYSPYDNVEKKSYPNLLITTGLHDSQVQYFEPAKWVAKLREMKVDKNILLMKTNMSAGHSGKTGRFQAYQDIAFEYAFFLNLAGIKE